MPQSNALTIEPLELYTSMRFDCQAGSFFKGPGEDGGWGGFTSG